MLLAVLGRCLQIVKFLPEARRVSFQLRALFRKLVSYRTRRTEDEPARVDCQLLGLRLSFMKKKHRAIHLPDAFIHFRRRHSRKLLCRQLNHTFFPRLSCYLGFDNGDLLLRLRRLLLDFLEKL